MTIIQKGNTSTDIDEKPMYDGEPAPSTTAATFKTSNTPGGENK